MDQLQKDLRKLLSGKQYLLVLDDVWEENCEKWLKLKDLLVNGVNGSRVLVTTRSTIVAGITGTVNPYQLGILDEDRSWSLFKRMAFKHGQEPKNSDKVNIGMEIVKRCGGIPLAIRTIGSMLRFKNSDSEWFLVNKEFSNVSQQIKRNDILPTLKLSYDHLPSHLKRCFAYCRLFPKDSHIGVPTLVELWIAQGFFELSDSSYQCLEDVGYRCFTELLERSFFQEVKLNDYGTIMGCKMHDLMHDLAILVAGTECANLDLNHEGNVDKDTHHVSLDFSLNSLEKIPTPLVQASRMRTILLFDQSSKKESGINTPILDAIILKFKFLRALDLSSSGIQTVPSSIGKLKHLRYLDLSRNYKIEELPDSITNLLNLQTLKISFCSQLKELPGDIKKLVNLRHLEFSWYNRLTHMPHGLGRLTQLQTLSKYILSRSCETSPAPRLCGKLNELMTLNNLRGNLEIENLGHGNDAAAEAKDANLKEKQYLQSLFLNWEFGVDTNSTEASHGYKMSVLENLQPHMNLKNLSIINYRGAMFSSWLSSLTNLVDLSLINCVNCQYPVPLSQFHSLKRLRIINFPFLKHISDDGDDSFYLSFTPMTIVLPSLQHWLEELPNLRGWWSKDLYHVVCGEVGDSFAAITTIPPVEGNVRLLPSFPCLSKLVIRKCPLLTFMPLYPHLEEKLDLRETSLKPFQETMMSTINTGPSSLLSPLSKLRNLHIESRYEDLQFLKDSSKSLTSLKRLGLSKCFGLKDLYPVIQNLASLQELSIGDCEDLDMLTSDNSIFWKAFNGRLHSLKLSSFQKMVALPHGIQYVTSLKELSIWYCESLTTIPEWIIDLKSLKKLEVWNCPSLTSLPEGIQRLTSNRLENVPSYCRDAEGKQASFGLRLLICLI
ncbi:NB-ARC domain, LRR domain containing protein [Trema orientale]|uniref:NB-ARC domain, LRR domain containing protein n=1 Tax=Trema orientale TaxID=63057 RepID=A0A2P5FFH4_TREOI|nr:NB-ARC domain, LRR domain containing protein [Trema orientale]